MNAGIYAIPTGALMEAKIMKIIFVVMLLVGLGGSICFSQTHEATQSAMTRSNDVRWLDESERLASHLDVQLSVEFDELLNKPGSSFMSPLNYQRIPGGDEPADVDAFVKVLEKWLPKAAIVKDSKIPRCIHVVEGTLNKIPNYVMNQKMSINFEGTFAALVEKLQKQSGGNLMLSLQGTTPGTTLDYNFVVKVNVTDAEFREIISAAIASTKTQVNHVTSTVPATMGRASRSVKQSGICWTAFSVEREGKVVTYLSCN
jgi:hypothetical protein